MNLRYYCNTCAYIYVIESSVSASSLDGSLPMFRWRAAFQACPSCEHVREAGYQDWPLPNRFASQISQASKTQLKKRDDVLSAEAQMSNAPKTKGKPGGRNPFAMVCDTPAACSVV